MIYLETFFFFPQRNICEKKEVLVCLQLETKSNEKLGLSGCLFCFFCTHGPMYSSVLALGLVRPYSKPLLGT